MTGYDEFLAAKVALAPSAGFDVHPDEINPRLFAFQRRAIRWVGYCTTAEAQVNVPTLFDALEAVEAAS